MQANGTEESFESSSTILPSRLFIQRNNKKWGFFSSVFLSLSRAKREALVIWRFILPCRPNKLLATCIKERHNLWVSQSRTNYVTVIGLDKQMAITSGTTKCITFWFERVERETPQVSNRNERVYYRCMGHNPRTRKERKLYRWGAERKR